MNSDILYKPEVHDRIVAHNNPIMFIDPWGLCAEDLSYPEWLLRDIGGSDNAWAPWVTGEKSVEVMLWVPTVLSIDVITSISAAFSESPRYDVKYWPPFTAPTPIRKAP